MPEPYAWTTDDDEIAMNAIVVGIGDDGPAFADAGLSIPQPIASVYWPDWIAQGDKVHAGSEGPYSVADALERADFLCALWGYDRVVIALQRRDTWRAEWGELRAVEGYD